MPTSYIYAGPLRVASFESTQLSTYHQDHLGGTALVTDATGTTIQLYDYAPFGEEKLNTSTSTLDASYSFTGKEYEEDTGLYYFEARWYNPTIGRFVSEDPAQIYGKTSESSQGVVSKKENIFTNQYLSNPQYFNLYSYALNNPLKVKDVTGEWALVDNLLAAGAGAVVGLVSQGVSDIVSGEMSSWESYAGAAVGGAVGAEVLLHTGNIGLAGAAAGATENALTQGLENLTGESEGFDTNSFVTETVTSTVTSYIPGPDIPGITSGKGSFEAVSNSISTKLTNGTIQNISTKTATKIFTVDVVKDLPQCVVGGVLDTLNK